MVEKELKNSRDKYVKRLKAKGNGILNAAYQLDVAHFDDADDLKTLETIATFTEDLAAEMGELMEDIWVLAQDLKRYLNDQEEEHFD